VVPVVLVVAPVAECMALEGLELRGRAMRVVGPLTQRIPTKMVAVAVVEPLVLAETLRTIAAATAALAVHQQ
jgi:hypothetical protein